MKQLKLKFMRYLYLSFILSIGINVFCQEAPNSSYENRQYSIFRKAFPGKPTKLVINISNYTSSVITKFRENLSSPLLSDKIISVYQDNQNQQLTIIYNDKLKEEEFISIFNEYKINYYKKTK